MYSINMHVLVNSENMLYGDCSASIQDAVRTISKSLMQILDKAAGATIVWRVKKISAITIDITIRFFR